MADFIPIDLRLAGPEEKAAERRNLELCFRLNHLLPQSEEYLALVQELFGSFGAHSLIYPAINVIRGKKVHVGANCVIMNNCLFMAAGGITIEDNVQIAANVQLLTNNHDPRERMIILCKPIHICRNVWLGAGASILPGVTVGENSIVGACAVVTKDVPPNTVVAGVPAKKIRTIEQLN